MCDIPRNGRSFVALLGSHMLQGPQIPPQESRRRQGKVYHSACFEKTEFSWLVIWFVNVFHLSGFRFQGFFPVLEAPVLAEY